MSDSYPNIQNPPTHQHSPWLCFLIGFSVTFIVCLVAIRTFSMHPSGQFVVRQPLWSYYVTEIPLAFTSRNLGPGSGSGEQLTSWVVQHLLISTAGGAAAAGFVWVIRKLRSRFS